MSKNARTHTRKSDIQKTGPGRPAGSPNIERPTAVAVPAHCPSCQSTAYVRKPGCQPIVLEHAGANRVTGQPFAYVVWTNVICKACGQHFRVRTETTHDPRIDPF